MIVFNYLYKLIIGPLDLLLNLIFKVGIRFFASPGYAIIFLSLVVNFLILPLYLRADKLQLEEAEKEKKLQPSIKHIKQTFEGEERFMILQAYYRQNDYNPTDALKGAFPLLLQIPFFIGAYKFLSNLNVLEGYSFGPFPNLSTPDGLITVAGITINILPVLMTLINIVSSMIYSKGLTLKKKLSLYIMALLFLVILYNSPSGLVLYWTLNNVFSLLKNVVYKFVNHDKKRSTSNAYKPHKFLYYCSLVYLVVLLGIYIPITVISASPSEFVSESTGVNPLFYVFNTFVLATGTCIVWPSFIYVLMDDKWKKLLQDFMVMLSVVLTIDFMAFGNSDVTKSNTLRDDAPLFFSNTTIALNILIVLFVIIAYIIFMRKKADVLLSVSKYAVVIAMVAMLCISSYSIFVKIIPDVKNTQNKYTNYDDTSFNLEFTKSGKNVVVLMLDRAIGAYIPYIFNEKPELKTAFSGFTYYPSTLSYGNFTNFALPSLYGGYEYTPYEMTKRKNKSLKDDYNEALKVMPTLFGKNDFRSVIVDPSYAGYEDIPNLDIFDDVPNAKAHYSSDITNSILESDLSSLNRNLFCYSVTKCAPVIFYSFLYDYGSYNEVNAQYDTQEIKDDRYNIATGIDNSYTKCEVFLDKLDDLSVVSGDSDSYISIVNNATHQPTILQEPNYEQKKMVDNTKYEGVDANIRSDGKGNQIKLGTYNQVSHYHVNIASLMKVAKWIEWMKKNGVYDNTRIIIVSDHGKDMGQFEGKSIEQSGVILDMINFNPLLMVKDFNSKEFKTDNSIMTNADVPYLAMEGVIKNPKNPFTGKKIESVDKTGDHYVKIGGDFRIDKNQGNVYKPGRWAIVKGDCLKRENWKVLDKEF